MLRDGGEQLTMGVFSTSTSLVREDAPRSSCKYPVSSQSLTDAPDMFISIGASEGPWLRVGRNERAMANDRTTRLPRELGPRLWTEAV